MPQLITEWSTPDPQLQDTLDLIRTTPDGPERWELEAALHTWQAQWLHRKIGRTREWQERQAKYSTRNRRRKGAVGEAS